jgi:hypothetical protein
MVNRSRELDKAMAGDDNLENFHPQHVERRGTVRSGRGGYRSKAGLEGVSTSRWASSCDNGGVRKTANNANAVMHNQHNQQSDCCTADRRGAHNLLNAGTLEVVVRGQATMHI